jgi:hypothetical protein
MVPATLPTVIEATVIGSSRSTSLQSRLYYPRRNHVLRVIIVGISFFGPTGAGLAEATNDQVKQNNFLFNLSVVMSLEKLCPSIQINKEVVRQKASEAGIDLSQGISPQKYPGLVNDFSRGQAFVAMMNDAGGAFPCAQIGALNGKPSAGTLEWQEFIQSKPPQ